MWYLETFLVSVCPAWSDEKRKLPVGSFGKTGQPARSCERPYFPWFRECTCNLLGFASPNFAWIESAGPRVSLITEGTLSGLTQQHLRFYLYAWFVSVGFHFDNRNTNLLSKIGSSRGTFLTPKKVLEPQVSLANWLTCALPCSCQARSLNGQPVGTSWILWSANGKTPCRLVRRQRFEERFCVHLQGWAWDSRSPKRRHLTASLHGAKHSRQL